MVGGISLNRLLSRIALRVMAGLGNRMFMASRHLNEEPVAILTGDRWGPVRTGLQRVLAGCRRIETTRQRQEVAGVKCLMKRMRAKLPGMEKRMRDYDRLHAPCFNVFQAVGIERKEAVLHTPFLAFLLNPESTHGQGFVFLEAFFDTLRRLEGFHAPHFRIASFPWVIDSEVPAGSGGIIDLLIECPAHRYVLAIENKVDAEEGEDQLWKYDRWIEHSRPHHLTCQLIFLTLDGRAPTSNRNRPCLQASYATDVHRFLDKAMAKVHAEDVKTCLRHYQRIVQQIANISPDYATT